MLATNRKNISHGRGSNSEPAVWEPCYPKPTAFIFLNKRVGNSGLKKEKEKRP